MNMLSCACAVRWRVIAAAAAAWTLGSFAVNAVGFRGPVGALLREIHAATIGLVEPTLVGSAAILLLFLTVVVAMGRVPLASVGWTGRDATRALLPVTGFWLLMQGTLGLLGGALGNGVALHPAWHETGTGALIGGVLAQLFGNALAEETAFRGFFFRQFLLEARALRPAAAFGVAALASALLFAVTHLPNRLFVKELPIDALMVDQAQLVFAGVLFAMVFAVTRNVFTTAGLHTLANDPVPLLAASAEAVRLTYIALLAVVIVAGWIARTVAPSDDGHRRNGAGPRAAGSTTGRAAVERRACDRKAGER